jgi:sugar/nucleoside kinase (ribokinase family)
MTYLVEMPGPEGWHQALRHDVMFGNERELRQLTGAATFDEAVERTRSDLPGNACRVMFISRGPAGSVAIRHETVTSIPAFEIDVVDTTGAGDAFAAGCIWGLTEHLSDAEVLVRGNAVGGMACRALGARAALPDPADVESMIRSCRPAR